MNTQEITALLEKPGVTAEAKCLMLAAVLAETQSKLALAEVAFFRDQAVARVKGLEAKVRSAEAKATYWHCEHDRICELRDVLYYRVNELEAKLHEVECKESAGGYAAQELRRRVGLDNSKEDLCEVAAVFDALNKRVKELEGLRITGMHFFAGAVGVAVTIPLGSTPEIGGTLGDAMPRKEGAP